MLLEVVLQKINWYLDGTKGRTEQQLRLVTDSCLIRLHNVDTGELQYIFASSKIGPWMEVHC
jgi:hypothetical protein